MRISLQKWCRALGLQRGIERHNFAFRQLMDRCAETFPYRGRVVDLGCGTAPYKDIILAVADEYIGVDWTKTIHDQSRVDVFADLSKPLPFADSYADTVVSFEVLEHLPEPILFLSECNHILRPGGMLFMTVPFMWQIHEEPHDYFRYTQYGLRYLLEKNGFSEIAIKEKTGFWLMWWLRFNYHTVRFARGPVKYLWYPVWCFTQVLGILLDKVNPGSGQPAGYVIQAKKPGHK